MERNGSQSTRSANTTSSDFVLQWGNRKKLRCMKSQGKDQNDPSGSGQGQRRVERRVVRSDRNVTKDPNSNGSLNLRHGSPSQRILRNSENSIGMRSNGTRGLASPDKGDKKSGNNNNSTHINIENNNNNNKNHNDNNNQGGGGGGGGGSGSSDNHDGKKSGSSSGGDSIAAMWPPKFVIALTNKEKEEDFMLLKGSKLPQRPKKRAKFIQRTLNLVSPGSWLCDLTLERYEVREKKVTKKRPRGLKAMVNCIDSDSE